MFHKILEGFIPISGASIGFLSTPPCGAESVAGGWPHWPWLSLRSAGSGARMVSLGMWTDVCVVGEEDMAIQWSPGESEGK